MIVRLKKADTSGHFCRVKIGKKDVVIEEGKHDAVTILKHQPQCILHFHPMPDCSNKPLDAQPKSPYL